MPKRTQPAQNAEPIGSDLIRRLLDKDSAFRAFIRRRIDNPAVADDVLQQAFVRAIEHHHSVRDDESVVAWFYRVLRNTIIDYYRTQGVESRRNEALLQELTHLGEDQERPFDELQEAACQCLHDFLPVLRPNYTEILRRIDLHGETLGDVANDLKVTLNNLTVRLHRARQALRRHLEQVCGICSTHGCLNCSCK
jgi:RNA polymerase sigma factor (sigma-70 family)